MNLRVLGFVIVGRAHNNMKVSVNGASQGVLGQHAFDGVLNHAGWRAVHDLTRSATALTAWVTRVTDVLFVVPLVARQCNLFSVDDNYVISTVRVRRKVYFVLPSKQLCNFGTDPPKALSFHVNNKPLLVGVLFVDRNGLVTQRIHGVISLNRYPQKSGCEYRMKINEQQLFRKVICEHFFIVPSSRLIRKIGA